MKNFHDYVMVCNSTGNQTVNLIPALQFKCKKMVIISTDHANKTRLTDRLTEISKKYAISTILLSISDLEEKNLKLLSEKLEQAVEQYNKVLWNISGGQKIPSGAMLIAFQHRIGLSKFQEDYVTYVEARPPYLWYFGHDYISSKEKTSVVIPLHDILYLYGYETVGDSYKLYPEPCKEVKDNIDIGKKALTYFQENGFFREAFFNHMKPPKGSVRTPQDVKNILQETLLTVKPALQDIKVTNEAYKGLEKKISIIFSELGACNNHTDLEKLIKPLKIIQNPKELYKNYWDSIKELIVDQTLKKIKFNEIRLVRDGMNEKHTQELVEQIKSIGGEIKQEKSNELYKKDVPRFSSFKSNGLLFEWLVAAQILNVIEQNKEIKESISQIYKNVKTKALNSKTQDAEHDIVIITKFGTLIIIELKTYEFSGDLVQAQSGLAYKKSGPYGTAIIIGPLFSNMINKKENGQKIVPYYIDGPIKTQQETAEQNGIEYYCLDQLTEMLQKKLYL